MNTLNLPPARPASFAPGRVTPRTPRDPPSATGGLPSGSQMRQSSPGPTPTDESRIRSSSFPAHKVQQQPVHSGLAPPPVAAAYMAARRAQSPQVNGNNSKSTGGSGSTRDDMIAALVNSNSAPRPEEKMFLQREELRLSRNPALLVNMVNGSSPPGSARQPHIVANLHDLSALNSSGLQVQQEQHMQQQMQHQQQFVQEPDYLDQLEQDRWRVEVDSNIGQLPAMSSEAGLPRVAMTPTLRG